MKRLPLILLTIAIFGTGLHSQVSKILPKILFQPEIRNSPVITGDSIAGSWSFLTPMPHTLWGVNSIYIDSSGGQYINKIFICGGTNQNDSCQKYCYYYNLSTNQYETADNLPVGRTLGTLLRMGDSLYLVASSRTNFIQPDGNLYLYNINLDLWELRTPMPSPPTIESSVFIWHNKIVVIGGSTSGFGYPTDIMRTYDPLHNTWTTSTAAFIRPTTASASASSGEEIMIVGGTNGVMIYNDVISAVTNPVDTIPIDFAEWGINGNVPYPGPVLRAGCGEYWGNFIFGPAFSFADTVAVVYNQMWKYSFIDSIWHKFVPGSPDSLANIPGIAIKPGSDSVYLYLFGGVNGQLTVSNHAKRFAFANINPIGIKKTGESVPLSFKLYQNYPNPFNPVTTIKFDIPQSIKPGTSVKLVVYDILGREIRSMVDENKLPGEYSVQFDGLNLGSGVYIYRLQAGGFVDSRKMIILK